MNVKDQYLGEKDALAMAREADEIYAAKGKKVVHLVMKRDKPDAATIKSLLVGPTGRLRAPTLRVGRKLLVGFSEEAYKEVLSA